MMGWASVPARKENVEQMSWLDNFEAEARRNSRRDPFSHDAAVLAEAYRDAAASDGAAADDDGGVPQDLRSWAYTPGWRAACAKCAHLLPNDKCARHKYGNHTYTSAYIVRSKGMIGSRACGPDAKWLSERPNA